VGNKWRPEGSSSMPSYVVIGAFRGGSQGKILRVHLIVSMRSERIEAARILNVAWRW